MWTENTNEVVVFPWFLDTTCINVIWNTNTHFSIKHSGELRKVARTHKNAEFTNIWLGQSINQFSGQSTAQIIKDLIEQAENYSRWKILLKTLKNVPKTPFNIIFLFSQFFSCPVYSKYPYHSVGSFSKSWLIISSGFFIV